LIEKTEFQFVLQQQLAAASQERQFYAERERDLFQQTEMNRNRDEEISSLQVLLDPQAPLDSNQLASKPPSSVNSDDSFSRTESESCVSSLIKSGHRIYLPQEDYRVAEKQIK
jgi:hypothetical protein